MPRKSPRRHRVDDHKRKGKTVKGYWRGHGTLTPKKRRIEHYKDSDIGRPEKIKKVGDSITYKSPHGRPLTGTVVKVFKKHYVVQRGNKLYRVNKGSILYQIGRAIGGAAGKIRGTIEALKGGYQTEQQAVQEYIKAQRLKRLREARARGFR